MCYICSCFANCLDLLQRLITFGLACLLSGAVCIGLLIAIIAGIAYGYNYCMAEFITFTRSDVTVYMRRGQFYDKPDLPMHLRRSGEEDLFGLNKTTDYEEPPPVHGKPLSDTWMKSQDTRKYAEKLTKYSPPKTVENPPRRTMVQDPIVPPVQMPELNHGEVFAESGPVSIIPNRLISTQAWKSGDSTIVMRNFEPMQEISRSDFGLNRELSLFSSSTTEPSIKSFGFIGGRHKDRSWVGGSKLRMGPTTERVRTVSTASQLRHVLPDYVTEEVDEDNIVYKPV